MEERVVSPVIATAKDRCRRCFSCVRRCPAKAIRVRAGQAEVMAERCLACGRCVTVCSQNAKEIRDNMPGATELVETGVAVALVAPSFAAAYPWRPEQTVAALRRAGFAGVYEVAFGADLVARAYRVLHERDPRRLVITTPCPAVVGYVSKYAPELVPYLAPFLSPMGAMGKVLKTRIRPGCKTVFIGPCTAKMLEAEEPEVRPWVDSVVTFQEAQQLFERHGIDPTRLDDEEYDPPHSALGGIFPVDGGLLRAARMGVDLLENEVAVVAGPGSFIETCDRLVRHVRTDTLDALETRLFDVLFCRGCLAGAAMPCQDSLLARKERVVAWVRARRVPSSRVAWEAAMGELADVDLERAYSCDALIGPQPDERAIRAVLERTNKHTPADELNCQACGYHSCRDKAIAVIRGLAEEEMCLPYLIESLESSVVKLNESHRQLSEAQAQLLRSERLASMGQLAAGIAHEVNNPLSSILIFAHLLSDQMKASESIRTDEVKGDVAMILNEATRCKGIVGGLLDFARQNKVSLTVTRLDDLLAEAVRISEAQAASGGVSFAVDAPGDLPEMRLDRQQMLQVLLNIIKNAVEVMPGGGRVTVSARYRTDADEFRIAVSDTGPGIPPDAMKKLFSPFFTTKPVGRGTGLGLPICYGIVKMHRGSITARNNKNGPGATFEIALPAIHEGEVHDA